MDLIYKNLSDLVDMVSTGEVSSEEVTKVF